MDTIKTQIKEKTQQLLEHNTIISNLKTDIDSLKKELYLLCEHNFKSELVTSGPYREYDYVCTVCGYTKL